MIIKSVLLRALICCRLKQSRLHRMRLYSNYLRLRLHFPVLHFQRTHSYSARRERVQNSLRLQTVYVNIIRTFIRHKDRQYKIKTETDRIIRKLKKRTIPHKKIKTY